MTQIQSRLAPEILDYENVEYDERSDIYSFGIVLFEIASRKLPYTEEYWERFQRNGYFQAKDCINAIVRDQCRPTPPPDCPPEFAKLMQVSVLSVAAPPPRPLSFSHADSVRFPSQQACWSHKAQDRPSFTQIVKTIHDHLPC